jgi:hypothetical protein
MSTSEGLSTRRSEDSQSHHRRLVDDGNVAYHLTHNAGKFRYKSLPVLRDAVHYNSGKKRKKATVRTFGKLWTRKNDVG